MVTGGQDDGRLLDSTEIFSDNVWRTVAAKLPRPMDSMKGATTNNRVLVFGNSLFRMQQIQFTTSGGNDGDFRKEVLEFNYESESWTVIGAMKEARYHHAVSVISFDDYGNDYKKWCN